MFSSSFPNRSKQQDEIPIVGNESLEDAVFALENSQVEGCYFEGMHWTKIKRIICKGASFG